MARKHVVDSSGPPRADPARCPRGLGVRGSRRGDPRLHGRLRGRTAGGVLRGADLPGGRHRASVHPVRGRPARASTSTSTGSSTWRRSTRGGSPCSPCRQKYGADAVSAGPDAVRPYAPNDANDGRDIWVVKITDHQVPDSAKKPLMYSLSVHGNERGGLEGGVRAAEDLAMAATNGGKVSDGIDNYESTTGRKPVFHSYEVRDVLAQEAVYLIDFNVDGWAVGDLWAFPPNLYSRGNSIGTDLNRQMPTVGRIDQSRNPLEESEMLYGERLMRRGRPLRARRPDGPRSGHSRRAELAGLRRRHVPGRSVQLGRPSPADGHRRAREVGHRRHALRRHRRRDRKRHGRQRRGDGSPPSR